MLGSVRTSDFDFELPPELIAQEPAEPRDAARLLVLRTPSGATEHRVFRELPALLQRGDLLVVNDTRVMAARLHGVRADTGGRVELLLVRSSGDDTWEVLLNPLRAARPGREFILDAHDGPLRATVQGRTETMATVRFERRIDAASVGDVPLPPYIKGYRGDPGRYQTVYSREARSAAAPTAGLHFTRGLLDALEAMGVERVAVTLEVGPGTFQPVTNEDPREHHLHAEHITVPAASAEAIARARREGRRVIAVGTTVVRTLEHVAAVCGEVRPYEGWTSLMILPGHRFRAIDALITNFHLPRSSLLMLVSAFAGREATLAAYAEAVRQGYRFYSFGDAMLILRG